MGESPKIIIDFLNVGYGESIVIRYIGDEIKTILVDGGDDDEEIYNSDPGRIRIIDYLAEEQIEVIDVLILSHLHKDHIGGIKEVVEKKKVKEAWINFIFNPEISFRKLEINSNLSIFQSLQLYKSIYNSLLRQNTKIKLIDKKTFKQFNELQLIGIPPRVEILSRLEKDLALIHNNEVDLDQIKTQLLEIDHYLNSTSIITKVNYRGEGKLLLTGDMPKFYWDDAKNIDLKAEIVKAPHHGDINMVSEKFLTLTQPDHFVVSVDSKGKNQLPSPNLTDFIKQINKKIKIYFTESKEYMDRREEKYIRFVFDEKGKLVRSSTIGGKYAR